MRTEFVWLQIFLQRLMAASEAAAAAQQSTTPKKPIDEAADTSSPLANFFSQLLKVGFIFFANDFSLKYF